MSWRGAGGSRRPSRKSGKANIRASVPAFPTHCTSMRRAPAAASTSVTTLTTASRARTRMPTHERHVAADDQADAAGDEHDPVRDRVEDLAELAALVEVAGDVAVDPVGRAEHREQRRRRQSSSSASNHRNTAHSQTGQGDHVRDRDDRAAPEVRKGRWGPIGNSRRRPSELLGERSRSAGRSSIRPAAAAHCSPAYAPPSTGIAAPVTNAAVSEHRNAAIRPKSSGRPSARPGCRRSADRIVVAVQRPDPLGVVEAGLERVHRHAVARDLAGQRLEERR